MNKNGWIALDIDGTITLDKYSVPAIVVTYLRDLHLQGWNIVLATGRPYAFASMALSEFDFPFILLAQNGSLGLELPTKKILFKTYLSSHLIPLVEKSYEGINSDFLIYAGYEKGDFCYWRPEKLSAEDLRYIEDLQKRQKEKWQALKTYDPKVLGDFPLIKCFGDQSKLQTIAHRLRSTDQFQVAMIQDPFEEGYRLLLVTDRLASKGMSLKKLIDLKGGRSLVIAAGDDENDLSLFEAADIKIAMPHAPEILRKSADFIAPPTQRYGIIKALEMALKRCL